MGYTLRVADRIALEMGVNEVEIISAYRSPAYNAHCEGARANARHVPGRAVFPVLEGRSRVVVRSALKHAHEHHGESAGVVRER